MCVCIFELVFQVYTEKFSLIKVIRSCLVTEWSKNYHSYKNCYVLLIVWTENQLLMQKQLICGLPTSTNFVCKYSSVAITVPIT